MIHKSLLGLTAVILSILGCFVIGELVCRFFFPDAHLRYQTDPEALYYFEPNQRGILLLNNGVSSPTMAINSLGLRGQYSSGLPLRRILFLGDSFTFGMGVQDNETFVHVIGQVFEQEVETINGGQPGYGVFQMEATLKRLVDLLRPELVVAVIWQGDFLRQPLSDEGRAQLFRQQRLSRVLKASVLVTHIYRMLERLLLQFSDGAFITHMGEGAKHEPSLEPFFNGVAADEPRLLAMHDMAKRYGKGLVVVLWPKEDFANLPSFESGLASRLTERLEAFSVRTGIPFASIQPAMKEWGRKSGLLIPGDWHPTPLAHCLAAKALLTKIGGLMNLRPANPLLCKNETGSISPLFDPGMAHTEK